MVQDELTDVEGALRLVDFTYSGLPECIISS